MFFQIQKGFSKQQSECCPLVLRIVDNPRSVQDTHICAQFFLDSLRQDILLTKATEMSSLHPRNDFVALCCLTLSFLPTNELPFFFLNAALNNCNPYLAFSYSYSYTVFLSTFFHHHLLDVFVRLLKPAASGNFSIKKQSPCGQTIKATHLETVKKLPECRMPDARVKGCYIMALAHSGVRGVHFFMEVASRKVDGWLLSMVDMP